MFWKVAEHTEQENQQWCWLRAVEWEQWPLFVSQPLIPPLLLFAAPATIFATLILVGWLWSLVRHRAVHPDLAYVGCIFVGFLKWPSALICSGLFLWRHEYSLAALAALWPAVTMALCWLVPSGLTGVVEKKFVARLLCTPETAIFGEPYRPHWSTTAVRYGVPLICMASLYGAWRVWTYLKG